MIDFTKAIKTTFKAMTKVLNHTKAVASHPVNIKHYSKEIFAEKLKKILTFMSSFFPKKIEQKSFKCVEGQQR